MVDISIYSAVPLSIASYLHVLSFAKRVWHLKNYLVNERIQVKEDRNELIFQPIEKKQH